MGHEDLNSNWVGAGHLKIGDTIKQADGTTGVVANVTTLQHTQEMFNLTVDEAHTFYVGQNGWLVHNAGAPAKWDVIQNPGLLWGKSPQEIAKIYEEAGFPTRLEQNARGSQLGVKIVFTGAKPEGLSQITVHPGGGSHGGPYIKLSTDTGIVKVIDTKNYEFYLRGNWETKATYVDYGGVSCFRIRPK